jgi:hypothetical protein
MFAPVTPGAARRTYDSGMRLVCALCLTAAVLLNGCGGGISFGFGGDWDDDFFPPSISLASTTSTVRAGDPVRFIAAASDQESGIDEVRFYRSESGADALLGSDGAEPFEWVATAPNDGRTSFTVYARAIDHAGNWTDSAAVTITITP